MSSILKEKQENIVNRVLKANLNILVFSTGTVLGVVLFVYLPLPFIVMCGGTGEVGW